MTVCPRGLPARKTLQSGRPKGPVYASTGRFLGAPTRRLLRSRVPIRLGHFDNPLLWNELTKFHLLR